MIFFLKKFVVPIVFNTDALRATLNKILKNGKHGKPGKPRKTKGNIVAVSTIFFISVFNNPNLPYRGPREPRYHIAFGEYQPHFWNISLISNSYTPVIPDSIVSTHTTSNSEDIIIPESAIAHFAIHSSFEPQDLDGAWYRSSDGANVGEFSKGNFIWHMDWDIEERTLEHSVTREESETPI